MKVRESRKDRVIQLKTCAHEIIDRAEELIGNSECTTGCTVTIRLLPGEPPTITLERSIVPSKCL